MKAGVQLSWAGLGDRPEHSALAEGQSGTHVSVVPTFLVIGAAKSGTTSLWQYLSQHPQVFMHPGKQLNFFSYAGDLHFAGPAPRDLKRRIISDIASYSAQFRGVGSERAVGECSNSYLCSSAAAERIHRHLPGVKLLAILRHPAERAYSRFLQLVQTGREEERDFRTALDLERARIRDVWWPEFHYLKAGLYYSQLVPYTRLFHCGRIKVLLNEDLSADPDGTMRSVFEFLGVDPTFTPDASIKYSVTGLPRRRLVHKILSGLRAARPYATPYFSESQLNRILRIAGAVNERNLVKPRLLPDIRRKLIDGYREDTLKLQDLLQRDLSSWLV